MSRIFRNLEYKEPRATTVMDHGNPKFLCSGLPTLFVVEGKYLAYVLNYTGWDINKTADVMGRSSKWVRDRITQHQLIKP